MRAEFIQMLDDIRAELGVRMRVSSGYRHETHPQEMSKIRPGEHTLGCAADILMYGEDALRLINIAYSKGIRRIGVSQKGNFNTRFIHLGIGDSIHLERFPRGVWTY